MIKGVAFALGACFIWGFIFVVPLFMGGFSSIEVALGRYLMYGIISSLIFSKSKFNGNGSYSRAIWIKALYYSLILTIGYYTFVVIALRYSNPAICALVLGISPILIAFYGNWKQRETTFRSLIFPSILILLGLVIINIPHLEKNNAGSYILGLICSLFALIAWSWYVVTNSKFLKEHPEIRSSDWTNLIGIAALFWVLIFAIVLSLFFKNQLHISKYFTPSHELANFFIGSAILGLLCSWAGSYMWNKASLHLPVSLTGQLTIFETIFGVLFVYILKRHFPPIMEIIGIVILLIAVVYGIRQFTREKSYDEPLSLL